MLAVDGLAAGYGPALAIADVAFSLSAGETLVLLGRNGAGKSTTLKALMGLLRPQAGSIRLDGAEIAGWEPFRIARAGFGYVPEERRIFADLSVRENLEVGRRPARPGAEPWTEARIVALFPALLSLLERRGGALSGGEQQMLTIARTLMGNPRLLLLDEPSEGLAPIVVLQMAEAIRALKSAGLTLLLSEQNFRFAATIADRALVLERGRVAWIGATAALLADGAAYRDLLAV